MKNLIACMLLIVLLVFSTLPAAAARPDPNIGVAVVLNTAITKALLFDLGQHGTVLDVVYQINALTMRVKSSELAAIQALPYVTSAEPDTMVSTGPQSDPIPVEDFTNGLNTWSLDAVNVTNFGVGRTIGYDGSGVYVAVLDSGLVQKWRNYFPEERIASEYAIAFGGGGNDMGWVSHQPEKWENDTVSHGTAVSGIILGFDYFGTSINGVAPRATVIPVKVINQNGSGWSSVIARGIVYVADLKAGALAEHPVIINMSLGGYYPSAMDKAAIDYAISKGVIVVVAAGNNGEAGMGYPGAYPEVISVAASGWTGQWVPDLTWWSSQDIADPTNPDDFFISDYSGRELPGQELDVAAPGHNSFSPYMTNSGQLLSIYYLWGTSFAAPNVSGIVALMAQKNPALSQAQAENILKDSAIYLAPGCRQVYEWGGSGLEKVDYCFDANATGAGLVTADAALALTP